VGCSCADGASGAQVCQADGSFAECACLPLPDAGRLTGWASGEVALFGGWDPSGVAVTLTGPNPTLATLSDAGAYAFPSVQPGLYRLGFEKSVVLPADSGWVSADGGPASLTFADAIPELLALPGENGSVVDGAQYPLDPFTLFPGKRLASGEILPYAKSDGGAWLAWVSTSQRLELVKGDGSTSAVQVGTVLEPSNLQFAPDGSHLAFLAGVPGSTNLEVVSTGDAGAVVSLGSSAAGFQFSPDGSRIAFISDSAAGTLRIADPTGVAFWGLGSGVTSFVFSPDSSHIAFLANGALMLATTVYHSTPVQLAADVSSFHFSSDGSQIAFLDAAGMLQLATTLTGSAVQVASGVSAFLLSPDGTHIACELSATGGPMLALVSASGVGPPVQLGTHLRRYSFTADGSQLAYVLGDFNTVSLYVVPTSGSAGPVQITTVSDFFAASQFQYWLSPDGSHIAFISSEAGGLALELVDRLNPGAPIRLGGGIPPISTFFAALFSADGNHIAFLHDGQGIFGTLAVAATTGSSAPTDLGTGVINFPFSFAFSPDGSRIAYVTDFGGSNTLQIARVEGAPAVLQLEDHVRFIVEWPAADRLVGLRYQDPPVPPYDFQDGLYIFDVPRAAP